MKAHAQFVFTRVNGFLVIVDTGHPFGFMTVTNDINNVLAEIHETTRDYLDDKMILYKDSDGAWDAVTCDNIGTFESPSYKSEFIPIRSVSLDHAMRMYPEKSKEFLKSKRVNVATARLF